MRRAMRRRSIRIITAALAVLAGLELIGQLAGKPTLPHDSTFTEAPEWSYPDHIAKDHGLFWRYRPNQTIRHGFFLPGTYTIDSRGFRTPEFADAKAAGVQRVICLGESNTFGAGVSDEAVWPRVLERELKARDPEKRRWEVINLAVTDYSTHQGAILAERELNRLHPDIVLFELSWGDHQPAGFGIPDAQLRMPPPWRVELGNALVHSGLVRWGQRLWQTAFPPRRDSPPGYPVWRVSTAEYIANVEKICRAAIAAGASPILVTSPIAWPPPGYSDAEGVFHYHHRYRRLGRYGVTTGGGKFVELANAFDKHPEFYDDRRRDFRHFNARGHAFAGEFLARYLLGAPADTADSRR